MCKCAQPFCVQVGKSRYLIIDEAPENIERNVKVLDHALSSAEF